MYVVSIFFGQIDLIMDFTVFTKCDFYVNVVK